MTKNWKQFAHKAKGGPYMGEWTLDGNKYPITKNGKIDCGRVKAANAYAVKNNDKKVIIKLDHIAKDVCGIDLNF